MPPEPQACGALTGVPLSSTGVVSDNPSSAKAIYAAKEDAIVDINSFVRGYKRSLANVAAMCLASEAGTDYATAVGATEVDVHFANPAYPSVVSESQAIMQQVQTFPWMADSDVPLRELGYSEEQVHQLRSDRRRSRANEGLSAALALPAAEAQPVTVDQAEIGQGEPE